MDRNKIYKLVLENATNGNINKEDAIELISMLKGDRQTIDDDIAIIGISAKFPQADNLYELWDIIINGIDCVKKFSDDRDSDINTFLKAKNKSLDKISYNEGAYLEDISSFDYNFFKISPKEAAFMDPNQRIFLETAWNAVEDAGYGGDKLSGSNTGVYVGYSSNIRDLYGKMIFEYGEMEANSIIGNLTSILPSRVSYFLNLLGPSMIIDTACSSSLVSVALASQSIKSGICDMAIAGGIKINLFPEANEKEKIGMESSDGRTRTFDEYADGAGTGEGVIAILLKPYKKALNDGDSIYALIKGSSINQDGNSIGITAPNPAAQTSLILKAWEQANIKPETISYIEAHGTATNLGDPIEISGIQNAFSKYTNKKQFCAISSLKSNIGHLYEASGISSLLKAVLALNYKKIPPTNYFSRPNKAIDFNNSPLYVNTKVRQWESNGTPRRCGINSFGISGTNCHIVLEEASSGKNNNIDTEKINIFTISAKSEDSFKLLLNNYKKNTEMIEKYSLNDICYTANTGRGHYNYRVIFIVKSKKELINKIFNFSKSYNSYEEDGIYFGVHKVVADIEDTNKDEDLIEKNKNKISKDINNKLEKFIISKEQRYDLLKEICSLYIQGADVNWEKLYQNGNFYKVRLPVYPFERKRCWFDISVSDKEFIQESKENDMFYTIKWIKDNKIFDDILNEKLTCMIFRNKNCLTDELIKRLKEKFIHVIEVILSDKYKKIDMNTYEISKEEKDYKRLLLDTKEMNVTNIIHICSSSEPIFTSEHLTQSQSRGVFNLFNIVKALVKLEHQNNMNILIVAEYVYEITGDEKFLYPQNAPLLGLGKVISMEYPHIKCHCMDIDEFVTANDILNELNSKEKYYQVAYRHQNRYIEEFIEVDNEITFEDNIEVKTNNVYIITGGTKGIGLEIAQYFASKRPVKIILISRTPVPERNLWTDIINSKTDKRHYETISKIMDMEQCGTEVISYSVDISNYDALKTVIDDIRLKYGKINGIVHSAGLPGSGYIIRKDEKTLNDVLKPKVWGTWNLDNLTANDNLDFFVMFSSGTSIAGEVGQGDYMAANAYLDSFSAYRSKLKKKTITINWVSWKETGMSVDFKINYDQIFKALTTEKALYGFEWVLNKNLKRVLIGQLNYNTKYLNSLDNMPMMLSEKLNKAILNSKKYIEMKSINSNLLNTQQKFNEQNNLNIHLTGKSNEDYTEIETKIANLYSEVLGYKEININDSFFELGGDSMLLNSLYLRIEEEFPNKVKITDLFANTTASKLAEFIASVGNFDKTDKISDNKNKLKYCDRENDVAIIGIAVEMPLIKNLDELWDCVANGIDCTSKFPKSRTSDIDSYFHFTGVETEEDFYYEGSYLNEIDKFDYKFFGFTPKEANLMDPFQRIFLQTVWHAIEDAGYSGKKIYGTKTGIYAGFASNIRDSYHKMILDVEPESLPISMTGNITAILPSRISYILNLKGPSMVIDTACSSSLVCLHLACQAIKSGDCDMAIASGIKLNMVPLKSISIGIESSNGRTYSFDDSSDGSGIGEGLIAVLLKPLQKAVEDKDSIYAVIKGSAINQDGASMGLTAPNPESQEDVILKAWKNADINPESLSYIEVHGTGTKLGDPIEIDSLTKAFLNYTNKKQFCSISTIKSNVGHVFECSGLPGLLKGIKALNEKKLPPGINFYKPNKKIDFLNSPIYVNTKIRKWISDGEPRRFGISSFGISGTNFHAVIEEAPEQIQIPDKINKQSINIFTLSAKSEGALYELVKSYKNCIYKFENHIDICYTASTGREHYNYRISILVNDIVDLKNKIIKVSESKFEQCDFLWFNYGIHNIVREDKKAKIEYGITNEEKNKFSKELNLKINQFIKDSKSSESLAQEIGMLYVKGAETDWSKLYDINEVRNIHLPGYPFEKIRCWIDIQYEKEDENTDTKKDYFFNFRWFEKEMLFSTTEKFSGNTIIFNNKSEISKNIIQQLKEDKQNIINVEFGNSYEQINEYKYILDISEESFKKLINSLKDKMPSRIIHLSTLGDTNEILSVDELENDQKNGIYSMVYLAKAISHYSIENEIDICIVSDNVDLVTGKEKILKPHHAPLFGIGKVMKKELPNVSIKCIDIDEDTLIDNVIFEINNTSDEYITAYRQNHKYIKEFREINLEKKLDEKIEISEKGVYVITGGTGGIGLEIAKYLASKNKANIVLINRSKFPQRNEWDSILKKDNSKISTKIKCIMNIEKTGAKIEIISADVSDINQIKSVFKNLRQNYGEIKGIIHGAGSDSAKFMVERDINEFENIINPKIKGTWILDYVTQSDNLDFFVMFSSIATIFTSSYQDAYVAANSYLDAFSAYRNKKGKKTLTINWATWKEVGMACDNNFNIDTLFKAIKTELAISCFESVFNKKIQNALLGEINYENKIIRLLNSFQFKLSDKINNMLNKVVGDSKLKVRKKSSNNKQITLTGSDSGNYGEIEKEIAKICEQILGFEEIDIHDNFFEMGVDSILLMNIQKELDKLYPGNVVMTDMFEYSTISKLAQHIKSQEISESIDKDNEASEKKINLDDVIGDMEKGILSIDDVLDNINKL